MSESPHFLMLRAACAFTHSLRGRGFCLTSGPPHVARDLADLAALAALAALAGRYLH